MIASDARSRLQDAARYFGLLGFWVVLVWWLLELGVATVATDVWRLSLFLLVPLSFLLVDGIVLFRGKQRAVNKRLRDTGSFLIGVYSMLLILVFVAVRADAAISASSIALLITVWLSAMAVWYYAYDTRTPSARRLNRTDAVRTGLAVLVGLVALVPTDTLVSLFAWGIAMFVVSVFVILVEIRMKENIDRWPRPNLVPRGLSSVISTFSVGIMVGVPLRFVLLDGSVGLVATVLLAVVFLSHMGVSMVGGYLFMVRD